MIGVWVLQSQRCSNSKERRKSTILIHNQLFKQIFPSYFLMMISFMIIRFTNEKAKKLSHYKPKNRRSPLNNFKPITYQEFYKFLGLCILIGNVAMPSMKHYWSVKNKLYSHPIFGQAMPRKKFELILRTLRFYDTDQKVEKKNKIEMVL